MPESNSQKTDYMCQFLMKCTFIHENQERMPELVQRIRQRFCKVEKSQCARRWLYNVLHPDQIPPLILPGQYEWARQILADVEKNQNPSGQSASV